MKFVYRSISTPVLAIRLLGLQIVLIADVNLMLLESLKSWSCH